MDNLPPEILLKIISYNKYGDSNWIYCKRELYKLKNLLISTISKYDLKNIIKKYKYSKYKRFRYGDIRYVEYIIKDINQDLFSIKTNLDFIKFHKTIIKDSWNIKSYKEFKLLSIILTYKLYNLTDYKNRV